MKIYINIFTFIFYIILIFSGYINYLLMYLIVIIIHELGHIVFIRLFNYKINKITIYPFGGIIDTEILINIHPIKQLLISLGGILFQLFIFIIPINNYNLEILNNINKFIILFNILPIFPLDGYKVFLSLIEYFYKYKVIIYISYAISFMFLFFYFCKFKNVFIFIALYITNVKYVLLHDYYFNKFILERYLYKIKYRKYKLIKNINSIYKCRVNYLIYDNNIVLDDEFYELKSKSIDKRQ